jgi:hypothetical protein
MGFLTIILNFLGGGVLNRVLTTLERKADNETERERIRTNVTIEEIRAELARRQAQRDVLLKESESAIQWLPRFTFGMTAAAYFLAVTLDSIFDLPGAVLALPDNEAAIMGVIVAGLFLDKAAKSLRK